MTAAVTEPAVPAPFGVAVSDVLALAAHAKVEVSDGEAAAAVTDTVFGGGGSGGLRRAVTTADVQRWIDQVAAVVSLKTRKLSKLTDPAHRSTVEEAAGAVVAVGAAAYLVDAAFPTNASPNDSGSYGAVLWTRYRDELAVLVEVLDEWTSVGGDGAGGGISGSFPPPAFPDALRW